MQTIWPHPATHSRSLPSNITDGQSMLWPEMDGQVAVGAIETMQVVNYAVVNGRERITQPQMKASLNRKWPQSYIWSWTIMIMMKYLSISACDIPFSNDFDTLASNWKSGMEEEHQYTSMPTRGRKHLWQKEGWRYQWWRKEGEGRIPAECWGVPEKNRH